MLLENYTDKGRKNRNIHLTPDLVIAGGGLAGTCAAITAAREGMQVVLVQDRPVLGGNASSEVRLWILGATSHMGNNNRWAREGGVIDEILVENLYRNKEGNPLILDTIILEKVKEETNITFLLNTAVYEVIKKNAREINSIKAFCSQNSTEYTITAPLFCDASGDGIVSFLAGASFRMGAETKDEFGEKFAPDESFGQLLGHSLYFYSKKSDNPVKYLAPSYALKDIKQLSRYKIISKDDQGCRFWWVEYGGRRDTVYETEDIKWELWKVVYGIWNHIKNSGEYEDVENLTLEWVGTIPGKRESRRFEGHYMLKQQDIVEQTKFYDAVAFGGWALDLHPADGVYSDLPSCLQYHSMGVYDIPLRSYISKDIDNLFFAGRIISASHVAFGSSRVMATCAFGGQAVAMAAKQCIEKGMVPKQLLDQENIEELQNRLNYNGQGITGVPMDQEKNLIKNAKMLASSEYKLEILPGNGPWLKLNIGAAQLLPLEKNTPYTFSFQASAGENTTVQIDLRVSSRLGSYTPDKTLESKTLLLSKGEQTIEVAFETVLAEDQYAFITFHKNEHISILCSKQRMTGILSVFNGKNKAVNNNGVQTPPEDSGIDSFEFWIPRRRPEGYNLAFSVSPALNLFAIDNLRNGYVRPYKKTNAWAANPDDANPQVRIEWDNEQVINEIKLFFDTDYDNALESVLMQHPENVIPFCVPAFRIYSDDQLIYEEKDNHQTIRQIKFQHPLFSSKLTIEPEANRSGCPASIFEIHII
ncbi:MAG: FAD-dependent oxidoreductase [Bacteroidales bacterium]